MKTRNHPMQRLAPLGAMLVASVSTQASTDYGPAIWNPMCNANYYTTGSGHKFHVIHDMEGYYGSTVASFVGCGNTSKSVHYAVNSGSGTSGKYSLQCNGPLDHTANDTDGKPAGEITQLGVRDTQYAWHARCWNQHCTGTEHEGFVTNPAWYTEAQYQASAALTRNLANKFGWPKDRNHVIGHNQKSVAGWSAWAAGGLGIDPNCNTHCDPGPYWDWNHYMALVNGGGPVPASLPPRAASQGKNDFNGDGKADVVTFVRGGGNNAAGVKDGDVYVALSSGTAFGGGAKWNEFFSIGDEVPDVGDFNGDGKSDIITFVRGGGNNAAGVKDGDVYVGLSTGTGFSGGAKWHEFFSIGDEVPMVGDFNGDGKDDIVTFVRGPGNNAAGVKDGDVYVALSSGTGFGAGLKWHEFFCIGNEVPGVGDVNGDGKDDIITFVRGGGNNAAGVKDGDVYVALSTGTGFGPGLKWQEFFCIGSEMPAVADVNGDGKADLLTFFRGTGTAASVGDVYVALSNGSGFLGGAKWQEFFCIGAELPGAADFTGDGKADIVSFVRGGGNNAAGVVDGDVYVAPSNGTGFLGGAKWNEFFSIGAEVPAPATAF